MDLGAPELLIILVIVFLLFGVGRVSKIGSELGQGLREFRHGLRGDEDQGALSASTQKNANDQGVNEEHSTNSTSDSKAE